MAGSRLPELDVERVRRWCSRRVPEHLRDQVRVECDAGPGHLTIVECRLPWRNDAGAQWTRFPIARLRYTKAAKRWSLYWRDRNLRFHRYDQLPPSPRVGRALRKAAGAAVQETAAEMSSSAEQAGQLAMMISEDFRGPAPDTSLAGSVTMREIMFRGSGGPLAPLADQLNHDLTHLP